MPSRQDRDDRDRPSWREVDRKRDGSVHVDRASPYSRPGGPRARDPRASEGYKAALGTLLEGGELPEKFKRLARAVDKVPKGSGSKRQEVLRKLGEAVSKDDVVRHTRALLELDGELPADTVVLMAVLRHPDEAVVRDAMRALLALAEGNPLKRKEALRQRVRQVEDLAEETETRELAAAVRRVIG